MKKTNDEDIFVEEEGEVETDYSNIPDEEKYIADKDDETKDFLGDEEEEEGF